jgi:hypothetical protein
VGPPKPGAKDLLCCDAAKTDDECGVTKVMSVYKYTSLEELNAVLKGHKMRAIRGAEHTVTYRNNRLLYFPLKESGERFNMYIKASALAYNPNFTKMRRCLRIT